MIIFLFGEDSYRARKKLNEIIESYKKVRKSGINLNYFNCQDAKSANDFFSSLRNSVLQASMFKEKKLQVIIDPFSNPKFKEDFRKEKDIFLKTDDIILICETGKTEAKDPFFKFLKKNAKCQEFSLLTGLPLKKWAGQEFEKYGAKVDDMALAKLVGCVGNDLWRMDNEIKKLVSFKRNRAISIQDVDALVKSKIDTDIFKTIDAVSQRDKKQALDLLHKHLEKGDSPLYLLSMINFQFRNLLTVKELIEKRNTFDLILQKSGLHPYVAKKSYFQSQAFDFSQLKKIYRKIFQVDFDVKTGKVEPEAGLESLVAEI